MKNVFYLSLALVGLTFGLIACGEDDGGGTGYALASTIDVTADSTLVVVDKTSSFYLEEDKSVVVTASAGGDLEVTCSYEEIS